MRMPRCVLLLVMSLCVSAVAIAQAEEKAIKEKRELLLGILETSLADVQNLRLPENRAVFYARTGGLIWLMDQKRARTLFRNAAVELNNAQAFAESKKSVNPHNELLQGNSTRQNILNVIASRDAELALELMMSTRPAMVTRAMETAGEKDRKISNVRQNIGHLAQSELSMEQNFYRLAAEQSPERAVRLLKEAIGKGLTNDTFSQLERLAYKDANAAAEIAPQFLDKLLQCSYVNDEQPHYVNISQTNNVLNYHISKQNNDERKLKFDDGTVRQLAAKFISAYLSDQRVASAIGHQIVNFAEKLQPGSVEQIKKATARMYPQSAPSEQDAAYQRLISGDTPVEQMLASADKFPMQTRRQIYQTASNKLMSQGNWQAARDVLTENFANDEGDYTIVNFDQQLVYNLIGQAKFAEAERIIDGLPEPHRVTMLIYLATTLFHREQKENRAYAVSLLEKARQMTNERPENNVEMGQFMQLIGGYAQIDAAEAIRLFEGLVPKLVELTDAAAVLNGFQLNGNVRDGEFIIVHGNPFDQYGGNSSMIAQLSKFDLGRTINLIDAFKRPEVRISLKLQMLEGSDLNSTQAVTRSIVALPIITRRSR